MSFGFSHRDAEVSSTGLLVNEQMKSLWKSIESGGIQCEFLFSTEWNQTLGLWWPTWEAWAHFKGLRLIHVRSQKTLPVISTQPTTNSIRLISFLLPEVHVRFPFMRLETRVGLQLDYLPNQWVSCLWPALSDIQLCDQWRRGDVWFIWSEVLKFRASSPPLLMCFTCVWVSGPGDSRSLSSCWSVSVSVF